ncbi:FecR domain-containing protein [Pseudomonas sp. RP23018S]|uniref:FecR domain-containing protein n=1 Tax=Pseudomonas sp. RP23018S TaxID=3096037 RepID=UPI002ACAA8FA|nr:FecR domain-containing protein [Pseudomonas sp. RP23018S]MDZ5602726.1 FecR domain-containing protein [Pseudomonas sp. RP23018S]
MNPADQRQALREAAQWHARLHAAPDNPQQRERWHAWIEQSSVNAWAWTRLEHLQAELAAVPGSLARHTLAAGQVETGRRTLLKGLALGIGVAGVAWSGYRNAPIWMADARTATGERRQMTLADGTRLTLNTGSAVDIRYSAEQRLIVLLEGEIAVHTASDPRPLRVRTAHGSLRALGTQFTVRLQPAQTELIVMQHAVAVHNAASPGEVLVNAGMALSFGSGPLPAPYPADLARTEWRAGLLVLDGWPLRQALAELQRYRPGVLSCSDEVAQLRVAGVYPLNDTDRALTAIADALQLKLTRWTGLWIRLAPAR